MAEYIKKKRKSMSKSARNVRKNIALKPRTRKKIYAEKLHYSSHFIQSPTKFLKNIQMN